MFLCGTPDAGLIFKNWQPIGVGAGAWVSWRVAAFGLKLAGKFKKLWCSHDATDELVRRGEFVVLFLFWKRERKGWGWGQRRLSYL